ncbi:MAG: hypothetical protein M1124_00665 [Candidatus Marsarchaeota archaeon]|nr:hypothetical protein [Candidatus Marsarchaeota archaeon]
MQDQNQTNIPKHNETRKETRKKYIGVVREYFKVIGTAVGISALGITIGVMLNNYIRPMVVVESLRTNHVLRQIKSEKKVISANKAEIVKDSNDIAKLYRKINNEVNAEKNAGLKLNINKPSYGISFKFDFKDLNEFSSNYKLIKKDLKQINLLRKDIKSKALEDEIISAKIKANEYFLYKKASILNSKLKLKKLSKQ